MRIPTPPCLNLQANTDRFPHRFPPRTFIYCYHYPACISHLRYLQLLCKLLVKVSHSCSTIVSNKEFKIIVVYTFKPPILLPISLAFFTDFSRISLSFTMASSQPDSPSDSEPEAIPESLPTLLSLYDAPPSLPTAIPESSPLILSLYTFPLPPLDPQYDTPEQGIAAINAFGRAYGYAVAILRSKITKKCVKKTVRLCCDRGRRVRPDDGPNGPARKRQTTSLSIKCLFLISLRL